MTPRWPTAIVGIASVGGSLAWALAQEGWVGVGIPLFVGAMLVLPGDLLRRAVTRASPRSVAERLAVNVVASLALLVALGAPLVVAHSFRLAPLAAGLAIMLVALAALAGRRHRLARDWATTAGALGLVVLTAAVALALFHLRPFVGDRISLGQHETALVVAAAESIPEEAVAFGTAAPFPVHYLFYDLVVGGLAKLGGLESYREFSLLVSTFRLLHIGFFALAWGLVGRAIIMTVTPSRAALLVGWALPAVLFLNPALSSKFREPLVEGFAIGLCGVAVWVVLTRGSPEPQSLFVAAAALGLLVGVHLPAFVEAMLLVGTLLVIVTVPALARRRRAERRERRTIRHVLADAGWPALVGPVVAILFFEVLGRGGLSELVGGSIENEPGAPADAFRALLLMSANPWLETTPREFMISRYLDPSVMVAGSSFLPLAALFWVAAAAGVVLWSRGLRLGVWSVLVGLLTLAYVGVGPLVGASTITPWNAIMRNSFYVWVPIAILQVIGVSLLAARVRGRLAPFVSAAVLLIALGPVVVGGVGDVRRNGWIGRAQVSSEGEAALRWLSRNTPADAVVLTSEVTYGSQVIAERQLLAEGKGTIESPEVTRPAIDVLEASIDFFLPVHDPRVLERHGVDFVVVAADGVYSPGRLGGLPMLADRRRAVAALERKSLAAQRYLRPARTFGDVSIYRVDQKLLPSVGVVEADERPQTDMPCARELCLVYFPAEGSCRTGELTSRPGVCVVAIDGR